MKYVSDLKELENKKYNSVEELEAAELEIKNELAKKEEAAKVRKEDAAKVEEAFKRRNAEINKYNTNLVEARKQYNKKLLEEQKQFEEHISLIEKSLNKAEEDYNNALKEFTDKHPEGYHMTLKDGDNVTTISRSGKHNADNFEKIYSAIDAFLDSFMW